MTAILQARGLEVKRGSFTLGPLDITLEPGRVYGLVGPNGAGKTTLLRALAGTLRRQAGEVTVLGQPAREDSGDWKRPVGYVPDAPTFYESMTGREVLAFFSRYYDTWDESWARELAGRLELELSFRVKQLSRGNRMKLMLTAALAHRPRLALFDEPTAGLDPVVRAEVFDLLWEMMEGEEMTVLYSTHIVDDLHRLAEELIFLRAGRTILHEHKDDLVDRWRRIVVRHDGELPTLPGEVHRIGRGQETELVSATGEDTLDELRRRGLDGIQARAMSLEEIAVQVLKGRLG